MEKKSMMTIALLSEKGTKMAGSVNLDLSSYVNGKLKETKETIKLDKCPDQNATITFTLKVKYVD
jgi:hypothetical protein